MNANEREAVRTTIVGGRPPGSGRNNLAVPRGIEVLVKKASVDPEFREVLLERRGAAAEEIGLSLAPAENAMLTSVPRQQLVQIIDRTFVPDEQRRAFLGKVAVAMLAVLGVGVAGCDHSYETVQPAGIEPDRPMATRGVQPDRPVQREPSKVPEGNHPDRPSPEAPGTNQPSAEAVAEKLQSLSQGIRPDRPISGQPTNYVPVSGRKPSYGVTLGHRP